MSKLYFWELRNPDGAMMGTEFSHALTDPFEVVLAHALPKSLDITVRDEQDNLIARAKSLQDPDNGYTPMSRLTIAGDSFVRQNIWPTEKDYGLPVILAGGEVGILQKWWNSSDHIQWRWSVEFYNHKDERLHLH